MDVKVARLSSSDQGKLDAWYGKAVDDETVSTQINVGIDRGSFKISDDITYIMDDEERGIACFSREYAGSRACDVSCWVLKDESGKNRRRIAIPLIMEGFKYLNHHSNIRFLEAYAMATNRPAVRFLNEFLETSWGTEPMGAYDAARKEWVGRVHYRTCIDQAKRNLLRMQEMFEKREEARKRYGY